MQNYEHVFTEEGARHDSSTLRSVYDHEQELLRIEKEKGRKIPAAAPSSAAVSAGPAAYNAKDSSPAQPAATPNAADVLPSAAADRVRIVTDEDLRTRPIKLKRTRTNFVMHDRFKARPQRYFYTREVPAGYFGQNTANPAGTSVRTGVVHIDTRSSQATAETTDLGSAYLPEVDAPLTLEDFDFPQDSSIDDWFDNVANCEEPRDGLHGVPQDLYGSPSEAEFPAARDDNIDSG